MGRSRERQKCSRFRRQALETVLSMNRLVMEEKRCSIRGEEGGEGRGSMTAVAEGGHVAIWNSHLPYYTKYPTRKSL